MSLTEEIANLTEASDKLTQEVIDKISVINQTLAAGMADFNQRLEEGMADLPSHMHKTVYVDQQFGSDSNNGSYDNPYKSLKKAIEDAPRQGFILVGILGEENEAYIMSSDEVRIYPVSVVQLTAKTRVTNTGRRGRINLSWQEGHGGLYEMTGLYYQEHAPAVLYINSLDIYFPDDSTGVSLSADDKRGFLSGHGQSKRALWQVSISNVHFYNPGTEGCLVGAADANVALYAYNTTASGMAGKWVGGIAAGTEPKDTGRVLSNLPTL